MKKLDVLGRGVIVNDVISISPVRTNYTHIDSGGRNTYTIFYTGAEPDFANDKNYKVKDYSFIIQIEEEVRSDEDGTTTSVKEYRVVSQNKAKVEAAHETLMDTWLNV